MIEKRAYIQATKAINFARGLSKVPYPTLSQFVNSLKGFDIRKEEEKVSQKNHNIVLSSQKVRDEETTTSTYRSIDKTSFCWYSKFFCWIFGNNNINIPNH